MSGVQSIDSVVSPLGGSCVCSVGTVHTKLWCSLL